MVLSMHWWWYLLHCKRRRGTTSYWKIYLFNQPITAYRTVCPCVRPCPILLSIVRVIVLSRGRSILDTDTADSAQRQTIQLSLIASASSSSWPDGRCDCCSTGHIVDSGIICTTACQRASASSSMRYGWYSGKLAQLYGHCIVIVFVIKVN